MKTKLYRGRNRDRDQKTKLYRDRDGTGTEWDQMKLYGTRKRPGPKNKTLSGPEPGPGLKKVGPAHL